MGRYHRRYRTKGIRLRGRSALIAIVLLIASGAYYAPFMSIDDPQLRKVIQIELNADYTRDMLPELRQAVAARDPGTEALAQSMAEKPVILSMKLSRSVLRLESEQDVIVAVEYLRPGSSEPRCAYYRYRHSLIGGWQRRGQSTKLMYYLNWL